MCLRPKTNNIMKFRLQTKNLFLTFPKLKEDFNLNEIVKKLKIKEKHIKYILVCKELHEDKSKHAHIFLHYNIRKNIVNPKYFDYLFDQHGDYQKAKFIKKSIDYIKKDGNFLE